MTTIKAPAGMSGLACEPFAPGEIYAVAANWAQASSPVLTYGERGWVGTPMQVADYRHRVRAALKAQLEEAIRMGGDEPDDDEIEAMLDDAVEIDDSESEE